ncbi:MAG: sulfatase family protein [Actinomycetota bacterium]
MRKLTVAIAVLAITTTVAGPGPSAPRAKAQAAVPPNVLIIMTDDQRRAGTLEIMDSLRRIFGDDGTIFSNAHVTTPLCCPSRASIFSGLYAHNHGIRSNDGANFDTYPHAQTVQAYLQRAGYVTGYFGKFFNRWPIEQAPPYFDRWAINSRGVNYRLAQFNVDGTLTTVTRYDTTYITDMLHGFLQETETDDARPWFAVLAPKAPHAPSTAQVRYEATRVGTWDGNAAVWEEDRTDKHPSVQASDVSIWRAQRVRRAHLRTLLSVDDSIEETFALLDELGEKRDTLAIYLSDNGFLWREHGVIAKRQPFIPASRVPLFVRGPHFERGVRDTSLVANIDLAPTILEAAGLLPDEPMDGRSLLSGEIHERLLLEYWLGNDASRFPEWAALLTEGYQYTEYYDAGNAIPTFREYYDLVADPWQLENLLGDGDVTNDPDWLLLSQQLREDRSCRGSDCP